MMFLSKPFLYAITALAVVAGGYYAVSWLREDARKDAIREKVIEQLEKDGADAETVEAINKGLQSLEGDDLCAHARALGVFVDDGCTIAAPGAGD